MGRTVNLKGNPVTLIGSIPEVGQEAPCALVVTKDLQEKRIGG
ncbi:MAG: 2-Cys peroxiredoxin, partial [Aquificae bacterium]|nr:2-Cys peroxiredoxin [Aquificota bacterium]